MREVLLLGVILNHPFLLETYVEVLADITVTDRNLDKLKHALVDAASSEKTLDRQGLRDHLTRKELGAICERVASTSLLKAAGWAKPASPASSVSSGWLHVLELHRRATQLEAEHRMAAAAYRSDNSDENFARMRALEDELKSINKATISDDAA